MSGRELIKQSGCASAPGADIIPAATGSFIRYEEYRVMSDVRISSSVVFLLGLLVLRLTAPQSCAAEFKAKVVDGLGRPLPDATVEVELTEKVASGKVTNVHRLKLLSDSDGLIRGSYDEKSISSNDLAVYVTKAGYESYSTGLRPQYELQRSFEPRDVRRIARLTGEVQQRELRELLAGDYRTQDRQESLQELVFLYYPQLGPALRALLKDPKVGVRAAVLLSFIGVPEDLRLVIKYAPPPKREVFEDRWAYSVVCALLEPATEAEWTFLKNCAINDYNDLWVDSGAIQALRLIASPRSLKILREVQKKNANREQEISRAIKYIESKPPTLSSKNLTNAGNAVAQAIKKGNWEGNKEPRLNDENDMALIDCEFIAGRDLLIYTATFHQVDGIWKLRGIRETLQALMANPPDRKVFVGVWHGYSESQLEFARLELKDDGTGLFALSQLPSSPPHTYRVTRWSQQRFQLDISLEGAEPEAEEITLKNVRHGIGSLSLEVHGRGWNRKMTLMNEIEFQSRAAAAKRTLEERFKLHQKER